MKGDEGELERNRMDIYYLAIYHGRWGGMGRTSAKQYPHGLTVYNRSIANVKMNIGDALLMISGKLATWSREEKTYRHG
jgi:hypothetical protein